MLNNLQRSRFVVWSTVILALVVGLLSAFKTVEEQATNTALIVASKRILEQANLFKQQYLLSATEPSHDLEPLKSYSRTGWIRPVYGSKRDCRYWLDQLYPQESIFGLSSPTIEDRSDNTQFHCVYHYSDKYQIDVLLKQERFSVKANILAL
ncbi:MSHA biogenesis protein MshF [Vibrio crassostreae]|uniref:MSHA biogenesis protein MshF n=1 Tax=Vibrio crassostreae TaxID=246167 RepID=UPI001047544C|nr:MSHA biogenesis protein MshF [Vibrio crassostreae]TCN90801.1 MSHA biogenesis protein MshF [Vibrio crassostreae]CAK2430551.1 MSHA biogenesis protein MshF [Vibrio crassostreae]CAK2487521.1 MSHA biogenesis protein MshF [Vibrio crassostreae]CAK2655590.1 MSHA biogenesis protein MshF [Vibrio crassostreae]CAK3115643.1 MSHA biogenesis protein MshF [Vibrio crassostreae]